MNLERAKVLLQATLDLLNTCEDGPYVEDALTMTVFYDETDCDGFCLRDDIASWLEETANLPTSMADAIGYQPE